MHHRIARCAREPHVVVNQPMIVVRYAHPTYTPCLFRGRASCTRIALGQPLDTHSSADR